MAVNPINGRLFASERFAVDYVQLTNDFRLFIGDPTRLESYPYYNAPIHAVGDGKVVSVRDNLPIRSRQSPSGLSLEQYAGNHIVQDPATAISCSMHICGRAASPSNQATI